MSLALVGCNGAPGQKGGPLVSGPFSLFGSDWLFGNLGRIISGHDWPEVTIGIQMLLRPMRRQEARYKRAR